MEYIAGLNTQTISFLFSLGFGLIIGILYDLVRTIRLIITPSKIVLYITDFLFILFAALATFLFCLTVTNGEVRWYILFGEIIGFFVYYFTFGVLAVRLTARIVRFVRKLFLKIIHIVFTPFRRLFAFLRQIFTHFVEKIQKKSKKTVKKSKFHLQIGKAMLYNLNDRMRLFCEKANKTKEK